MEGIFVPLSLLSEARDNWNVIIQRWDILMGHSVLLTNGQQNEGWVTLWLQVMIIMSSQHVKAKRIFLKMIKFDLPPAFRHSQKKTSPFKKKVSHFIQLAQFLMWNIIKAQGRKG